jgi:hypothetical protein
MLMLGCRSWQILAAWHSLAIGSPGISKFHEDRGPGAGDQKDGVGRFHQQGGKKHRRCIGDGDVFDLKVNKDNKVPSPEVPATFLIIASFLWNSPMFGLQCVQRW